MQQRLNPLIQPHPAARLLILQRPRLGHPRREFVLQRKRRKRYGETQYFPDLGDGIIVSNLPFGG